MTGQDFNHQLVLWLHYWDKLVDQQHKQARPHFKFQYTKVIWIL